MTDALAPDPSPVPDPTIVDPSAQNGQCDPREQPLPSRPSQGDPFPSMDQEMKISDNVEDKGKETLTICLFVSHLRSAGREFLSNSWRRRGFWFNY